MNLPPKVRHKTFGSILWDHQGKDGANKETEYQYDDNGNLTKDLNKKIAGIQYNVLNLPSRILFEDGNSISYLYAADGSKLRTTRIAGADTITTDYLGSVIYENKVPSKLLTEYGYITLNDNKYHYFIQDHQGNNRATSAFDLIESSSKLQNQFLGKNSPLSEMSKSELFNALNSAELNALGRPVGEALWELGAAQLGGAVLGKALGWGIEKLLVRSAGRGINQGGLNLFKWGITSRNGIRKACL